jgi:hypothetical protein
MDDLEKHIAKRKKKSLEFERSFEVGYENLRIGFSSSAGKGSAWNYAGRSRKEIASQEICNFAH